MCFCNRLSETQNLSFVLFLRCRNNSGSFLELSVFLCLNRSVLMDLVDSEYLLGYTLNTSDNAIVK